MKSYAEYSGETCLKSSPLAQVIEETTTGDLLLFLIAMADKALPKTPDDGIIIGKND